MHCNEDDIAAARGTGKGLQETLVATLYQTGRVFFSEGFFFFLMIRRPPRSTLILTTLSLHDALPIFCFVIGNSSNTNKDIIFFCLLINNSFHIIMISGFYNSYARINSLMGYAL